MKHQLGPAIHPPKVPHLWDQPVPAPNPGKDTEVQGLGREAQKDTLEVLSQTNLSLKPSSGT